VSLAPIKPLAQWQSHVPVSLAEKLEHEAMALRALDDPILIFAAEQLERVAGIARFLQAESPAEFYDRQAVAEEDLRQHWYLLGQEHLLQEQDRVRHGESQFPPDPNPRLCVGSSASYLVPEQW